MTKAAEKNSKLMQRIKKMCEGGEVTNAAKLLHESKPTEKQLDEAYAMHPAMERAMFRLRA